jgi:hypothetical protein
LVDPLRRKTILLRREFNVGRRCASKSSRNGDWCGNAWTRM